MITILFNGLGLQDIQALIKRGKMYTENGEQWFGDLNMFLNRFHSLSIESGDEKTYEPIISEWQAKDVEVQDKMEETDEHIMLDNFDCGHGFFGWSYQ